MGGGVNAREITWAGERRYFLPVSYRDRGASQPSPYVDYTSIKSESDAEYETIGQSSMTDTVTVGGAVNVGVDVRSMSALTGRKIVPDTGASTTGTATRTMPWLGIGVGLVVLMLLTRRA
jgi:hypothetical protein